MTRIRVVAAVIERGGRYLVGRRPEHKRHGGLWEFPGGKLDSGETSTEAAVRELREELELEVSFVGVRLVALSDGESQFVIEFHAVQARGEPVAHEHEALGWFTPDELMRLPLAPSDREFAHWLVDRDAAADNSASDGGAGRETEK